MRMRPNSAFSDNGVGFDVPPVLGGLKANSHLGLVGMQERADLFGGKLEIQSTPGKGTSINVTIPSSKMLPVGG